MNLQNFRSICGYHHTIFHSLGTACLKCVPPCLRRHHQVYPVQLQYENCEFLQLHPQRRIRVIHHNSRDESSDNTDSTTQEREHSNPHESGLDDYWFARGSHSSFRLFKKKSRTTSDCKILESPSKNPKLISRPLDSVRYSFHRKEKLKPCIEEEVEPTNQNKTLDSIASSLVVVILEEAISCAVLKCKKHQRCPSTCEDTSIACLPQNNVENSINAISSPKKLLQNGTQKQILNVGTLTQDLSGHSNQAFVNDDSVVVPPATADQAQGIASAVVQDQGQNASQASADKKDVRPIKQSTEPQRKKSNAKQSNRPLLLFLHGAGGSAEEWSPVLDYFAAAGYEVVAPDLLGHGLSSAPHAPRAYAFACLLQDALQIFDTFVPEPKKCVVIGHGYGCSFAAAVARYRPQSVVQLVLISGGGPTPLAPQRGIYSLPRCLLGCAKPLLLCGFRREYFYAARGKQLMLGDHWHVPAYVWSYMQQGQEWPQGDTAFHRRIAVPTLLVHGLQDPYITLVEECEMERTIPRSFLEVLPEAGHWAMLDAPESLCHMMHCFITLWDKSGALSK